MIFVEPTTEVIDQRCVGGQLCRGVCREAQSDTVGFGIRTNLIFYFERVLIESRESLGPRFAAMNIGAITEMDAVFELHCSVSCL